MINGAHPGVAVQETHTTVNADYFQYYVYGERAEFDPSRVDTVHDGILAPARDGARIATGAHYGPVDLTVRVVEEHIPLPLAERVAAAACNVDLPTGVLLIVDWGDGGRPAFRHDFGRPLVCGVLVEVVGRDEANAHCYQPGPRPREQHRFTISPSPFHNGRWRSGHIDRVGLEFESFTDHVGVDPATRPADLWYGTAGHPTVLPADAGPAALARPHKVLAEQIMALPPDSQRRLAVWAAAEACSRDAGTLPWQAALSAVLDGQPLPPPFDDEHRAGQLLPPDPLDGARVWPPAPALAAVLAAAGPDPGRAALDALSHAASAEPAPQQFFVRVRHHIGLMGQ